MEKARITAVSYLNTLPFVYGLKYFLDKDLYNLSLDVPSECSRKILENEADFGLLPVAVLPFLKGNVDVMDYCIAADGEVQSVLLVSSVPLHQVKTVYLDSDSRTSVMLVKVLSERYWHISPEWIDNSLLNTGNTAESAVVIGDKAFLFQKEYPYCYDLAAEWKKMTGLPFVFAVWVARNGFDTKIREQLNFALESGINNIGKTVDEYLRQNSIGIDLKYYLTQNIHFRLQGNYRKGLEMFLGFLDEKQ
jgi:chorismate dehydratase